MTIKEKLKADIERLKGQLIRGACASQIEMETNCKEEAYNEVLSFLDTIEEQPVMIEWTGNNLKEVIEFTGKSPRFDEWFKTWDEYESYVHSHGNVLKLFSEDGSHLEVPVGAWIFKTPDGRNVPSTFIYKEQPVDLEKEIASFITQFGWGNTKHLAEKELINRTARHFYELGRQSECVKVKAESALDKFMFENCTHCSIEHCPGVKACYTSSNEQLQ